METCRKKPTISCTTSEQGIDRISSLPDDVLHNILSSQCTVDVVQLSVLSKRWRYIWTTIPYLNFELDHIAFSKVVKLEGFIDRVLISHRGNITLARFIIRCYEYDNMLNDMSDSVDNIVQWIHALTTRNVEQLVLHIHTLGPFQLPDCVATCESLQVLELDLNRNVLELSNHLVFRHLKILYLSRVKFVDEHLANCLFSKSPFLETLILNSCDLEAMTLLDIASTSLIQVSLDIHECFGIDDGVNFEVKISCPNLEFFSYEGPVPKDIILSDLVSIQAVEIFFNLCSSEESCILVHKMIKSVPSTSSLKLNYSSIWGFYIAICKVRLSPVSLYNLKSLSLSMYVEKDFLQALMLLLKYSPYLEALELQIFHNADWNENWRLWVPDESIACLESHLKSIRLTDLKDDENEMELLRFFLRTARALEELMIVWDNDVVNIEEASEELLKFPRTPSLTVVTFLEGLPKPKLHNWI